MTDAKLIMTISETLSTQMARYDLCQLQTFSDLNVANHTMYRPLNKTPVNLYQLIGIWLSLSIWVTHEVGLPSTRHVRLGQHFEIKQILFFCNLFIGNDL